ncbi:MAG: ThuA domain-containing protein [Niabella sp.]
MKYFKRIFFTIAMICLLSCRQQVNAFHLHPPKSKVLVLTERGGQHEGFVVEALAWLKDFSVKHNLELRIIGYPREIECESLAIYRLFIQLNYPPYNWTAKTMTAFEKYIDKGQGAWIGFHHATLLGEFDGYPLWSWFSDFMGGIRFENYIAKKATANVCVEMTNYPVMRGVPNVFCIANDEWYTFNKNPRAIVNVLANVDESTYQPPSDIKMGDHPVIWSNEKKKAKNVYFLMGHDAGLLQNMVFIKMFGNAIEWALKK